MTFPSVSKFTSLNAIDYDHLKAVYTCDDTADDDEMVKTIRAFKTITLYKLHLGSCKTQSTKHSSYVMTSWAESSGPIGTSTRKFYALEKYCSILLASTRSTKSTGNICLQLFIGMQNTYVIPCMESRWKYGRIATSLRALLWFLQFTNCHADVVLLMARFLYQVIRRKRHSLCITSP